MDISIKQEKWRQELPLFETEFIHSHLLPHFSFNESTGVYETKSEFAEDEDRKFAYEVLNTSWVMWLRAKRDAKSQADALVGHITLTHERLQELIAIGVKAELDEREKK